MKLLTALVCAALSPLAAAELGARDPVTATAVAQVSETLGLDTGTCPSGLRKLWKSPLYIYTCGRALEGQALAQRVHVALTRLDFVPRPAEWQRLDRRVVEASYFRGPSRLGVRVDGAGQGILFVEAPVYERCFHDVPMVEDLGSNVTPPVTKTSNRNVPADYPEEARGEGLSASVVIQAVIGTDGTVKEACVAHVTTPGKGFEHAALDSIRRWRYEPARLGERPVAVGMFFSVDFEVSH